MPLCAAFHLGLNCLPLYLGVTVVLKKTFSGDSGSYFLSILDHSFKKTQHEKTNNVAIRHEKSHICLDISLVW